MLLGPEGEGQAEAVGGQTEEPHLSKLPKRFALTKWAVAFGKTVLRGS